jgi:hypothetical protein
VVLLKLALVLINKDEDVTGNVDLHINVVNMVNCATSEDYGIQGRKSGGDYWTGVPCPVR